MMMNDDGASDEPSTIKSRGMPQSTSADVGSRYHGVCGSVKQRKSIRVKKSSAADASIHNAKSVCLIACSTNGFCHMK